MFKWGQTQPTPTRGGFGKDFYQLGPIWVCMLKPVMGTRQVWASSRQPNNRALVKPYNLTTNFPLVIGLIKFGFQGQFVSWVMSFQPICGLDLN